MNMDAKSTKRYKHYSHSPFSIEHQGVKVEVNETGKVTITQEREDNTYDEINTSAALINKLSRMLFTTRKVVWRDFPYKEEEEVS